MKIDPIPIEGLDVWEGGCHSFFDENGRALPALNGFGSAASR